MTLLRDGEIVKAHLVGAPGPRDYLATVCGRVLRWEGGRDYASVNAFASAMAILHWNDGKPHTPHGATACSVSRDGAWVTLKVLEARLAAVAAAAPAPPVAAPAPEAPAPEAPAPPVAAPEAALRLLLSASEDRCAAALMCIEDERAAHAAANAVKDARILALEAEIASFRAWAAALPLPAVAVAVAVENLD